MAPDSKLIFDVVHGAIHLNELERAVVETSACKRLRNVKQLGLAHLIFPGADYSRFSHSIGACHVAGLMAGSLKDQLPELVTGDDVRDCRLAALLHDIGHLPFSHALERVLQDRESAAVFSEDGAGEAVSKKLTRHEAISGEVLEHDPELNSLLTRYVDFRKIRRLINREDPTNPLNSIISSDLDADRLDYLLRTARHTGLPYGSVDLPHLVSCLRQVDRRICLSWDGLRGAEHFLLGRFFDYQRVAFHRRVAGWEQVLEDVIGAVIDRGIVECSSLSIQSSIRDGTWSEFDDARIIAGLRELKMQANAEKDKVLLARLESILDARPPECVGELEEVEHQAEPRHDGLLRARVRHLNELIPRWSRDLNVPQDLWYVWSKAMGFTGAPAAVSVQGAGHEDWVRDLDEDLDKSVWILNGEDAHPEPLVAKPSSIFKELSRAKVYRMRLFVLLPPNSRELLQQIRTRVRQDTPDIPWTGHMTQTSAAAATAH